MSTFLQRLRAATKSVMSPSCEGEGFFGTGELGNSFPISSLDLGWQRNLVIGGNGPCAAQFAAVNVNAQAVATLDLQHKRRLKDGGYETLRKSPVARILATPNSYQTSSDFQLNLVFGLLSHGNAYALAMRSAAGQIESLHLVPHNSTTPHVDPESGEIFYAIGDNILIEEEKKPEMLVPARDVLHVRLHTPRHPLIGISPIKYAAMAVSVNQAISKNQAAFFNNMSRPSGILTTDMPLTSDQMELLRETWDKRSKGMDAGKVPILGFGLKWDAMTLTSEDAQLIEAYRMSIEDIARVYRVPLALMGDYTKATYSNTEQLIQSWLSTGLGFLLEHIEASFEKLFAFGPDESCDYDVDRLLRSDFAGRIDGLTKGVMGGLYSPNEARAKEGLPPVDFGDEPRLQSQVVPLSQVEAIPPAPSAPAAPVAPVQPEDNESKHLLEEILTRLNKEDPEPSVSDLERSLRQVINE